MLSKKAEQAREEAARKLAEAVPELLDIACQVLVNAIEEYRSAMEVGDQPKAEKTYRHAKKEAQLLKKYGDSAGTAKRVRELLDERQAPEEWHNLARRLLPQYR